MMALERLFLHHRGFIALYEIMREAFQTQGISAFVKTR
jgi:hypothetical protein